MKELQDFHWLLDMVQNIDVGLIVLDKDYKIQTWNGFMENHSGILAYHAKEKSLFDLFPNIDEDWFIKKSEPVFLLGSRAFTTWEQRPYIFKFKNYRPITGVAHYMYQNTTLFPLKSPNGETENISIIVYDVTDVAVNRMELKSANKTLEVLSQTDALTQLYNRGYWEKLLFNEFRRSTRTNQKASLLMFDIDHFKNVNDTYGHPAGDEVIRVVSAIFRECIRTTDLAGRYGGEEFGLILIDTSKEDALLFAERFRKKVENTPVKFEDLTINYTISLGISEFDQDFIEHTDWLKATDKALYQSKDNGRNQTTLYKR